LAEEIERLLALDLAEISVNGDGADAALVEVLCEIRGLSLCVGEDHALLRLALQQHKHGGLATTDLQIA